NINITLGGDLRVQKAAGDSPVIIGTVNTVRGTYQFQGRSFTLERDGTVRFVGGHEINPVLDVTATRKIPSNGVEARIHITGRATVRQLRPGRTPPSAQGVAWRLHFFTGRATERGPGGRPARAPTAGGIARGFIAPPLAESIGKALDLDLFEITTTADS